MKRPIVALISPNVSAASETFIQAHRDKIHAEVSFYTNGMLPTRLNNQPITRFKYQFQYYIAKHLRQDHGLSYDEFVLSNSLQEQNPDVVLCEYGISANASLSVIKRLGLPLIVYFHGYDASVRHIIEQNDNYKAVIAYAKKIFVVSRSQEKKLIELGAKSGQVIYNPCAPNDVFFDIVRVANPQQLFIAAGRFANKKAPHITLLAFKNVLEKYPKAKLIMAGDGELHQVVHDLATYYGIDGSVEFPGVYTSSQLQRWLPNAAAFVQHSVTAENGDQEGTPVVILEAMAAGVPVVATKHAGMNDIIVDGKTGYLVDEYDVKKMASKMIFTLDQPEACSIIGKAGREFVAKNLNMTQHIKKIDQAIASCI